MLMDVSSNENKTLDGFYNDLRRKYPDAFALATDLGRRNGSLQKLPRLEKTSSPILGISSNSPNVSSPQRWSPDSFISKVKYQKTYNEQRKEVGKAQQSGNAVIIKDQAVPIPTWTRKDYLEAQNGASFQLPTLRTQIEQNKVDLKNRLNPPQNTENNQSSTLQTNNNVQAKMSRDYSNTKTSRDYTTTRSTDNYTKAQTNGDYGTTKSTNDYTTTKTSRDYTTTKSTNSYTTMQTTRNYTTAMTTIDDTTIKSTKNYTTPQTMRDYTTAKTSRDYTTTKAPRDCTITKSTNNSTTAQTTKDYTAPMTTIAYTTIKPTKDCPTQQTIKDHSTTRTTRDYTTTKSTKDYTTLRVSSPSQRNVSGVKSDPLGTIMKELLPDKPNRVMKDLPKTTNWLSNNGGFVSDSDSGVSMCAPLKVFRPKIRSPQAAPASRDIIKKFSAKPQKTSEPLKADHSLAQENITQIIQREDNPVTRYSKSSINFNEKLPQGQPRARVHFEDESEEDAEFRYQERRLLERTQTTKMSSTISPGSQLIYIERNVKSETTERSSSPSKEIEKPQQTTTVPHRRQPFPPNVAKNVLIDIPRGGLPNRRLPQIRRVPPVTRDIANKKFSPRNVTSVDGITMSFTKTNHEWGEQTQSITAIREDERGYHSLSSLETLESGTTEASSDFTKMKKEWSESNSSIGSGNQSRFSSQNRDLNLDHTSQNKSTETSFYSKVRRSLRLKKKPSSESTSGSSHSDFVFKNCKDLEPSYTSPQIDGGVHGKSSPHSAAVRRLPNQTAPNASLPSRTGTKKDVMRDMEKQGTERTHPVKAPYSPMRMMQSLLKKGRAKDYLVRAPSPPPQEARSSTSSRYRREQIPDQASGRVLAIQPDSSHLVELERPKMGFSGLYLTKKNQNGCSGLYVVQLSGAFTSSFPLGILEVGDEILEINRLQAKDLRLDEIYTLLEESSCVLLRVSRNVL